MTQLADHPVLVDRAEACAILGVSDATFARLCREGRFEDMGGRGLWRGARDSGWQGLRFIRRCEEEQKRVA